MLRSLISFGFFPECVEDISVGPCDADGIYLFGTSEPEVGEDI